MLRIRGAISLRATVVGGLALMCVWALGENETPRVLNTASAFYSGDVLWWDTRMVPTTEPVHYEIDVRAKRKLENDSVWFSIFAVAQAITYAGHWRALIQRK